MHFNLQQQALRLLLFYSRLHPPNEQLKCKKKMHDIHRLTSHMQVCIIVKCQI